MTSNLDYLDIYSSWVDKATELSDALVLSAGLDKDEVFDAAHDKLKGQEVPFENISRIIVSTILDTAADEVSRKLEELGFEEGRIEIETYPEGLYSSIVINHQNQPLLQAVENVLLDEFSFLPFIEDTIEVIRDYEFDNIDELLEEFADNLTENLQDKYDIECYFSNGEFVVDNGEFEDYKNISELKDFLKTEIEKAKTEDKIIKE